MRIAAAVLAIVILAVVIFLMLFLSDPGILGYAEEGDLTATGAAIGETAQALERTAAANVTQVAFNATSNAAAQAAIAATNADLVTRGAALAATVTQVSADIAGTQTRSAQLATQAALDFQSTQAAVDQSRTQAALDFQGTQAALAQNATAVALGFATPVPGADLPAPEPTTREGSPGGVGAGGLWDFSDPADWRLADDGALLAQNPGAWLLSQTSDLSSYILNAQIAAPLNGFYYALLNVPPGSGDALALELFYDGGAFVSATLLRFQRQALIGDAEGIIVGETVAVHTLEAPDAEVLTVQVEVRSTRIVVFVNGRALLDATLEATPLPGAVGVLVPGGTRVERLVVLP